MIKYIDYKEKKLAELIIKYKNLYNWHFTNLKKT